ncbi:uncharacterized protein LOC117120749 [Anneissia japonica]|uniref:uncharacterized protein LOC117120749 n=1 Tax=Anneissia japonica TaxID=1529436 RepID=UPI0014259135|nr:uncharacterized protein LOC117120749 [Anneissia japonica]
MPRTFLVLFFINILGAHVCQACEPAENDELSIESKTYLAPFVVDGKVVSWNKGMPATVSRIRVQKGGENFTQKEFHVIGLGTTEPCIIEPIIEKKTYLFFLNNSDDGNYLVVANPVESTSNNKRKVRHFLKEEVEKPSFKKEIKDRYVSEGDKVAISCEPLGNPVPKVYWKKDGEIIDTLEGVKISKKGKNRLRIKSVSKELHEGNYECIADNGVDPPISNKLFMNISLPLTSVCAVNCDNGGTLNPKKCNCACPDGFKGDFCESSDIVTTEPPPVCEGMSCGDYGTLNETSCTCKCDKYYSGEYCTEDETPAPCLLECEHGELDSENCNCTCELMYTGRTCDKKDEKPCSRPDVCLNGGTCMTTTDVTVIEVCYCPEGYSGNNCGTKDCDLNCGEHGQLNTQDCQCVCDKGYRGALCDDEITTTPTNSHLRMCTDEKYKSGYCFNQGTCYEFISAPDTHLCFCPSPYGGNRCELLVPFDYHGGVNPRGQTGQEDQRKVIVYMTVIFVAFLITIGLCLICYLRYRKSKEKERYEKQFENLRKHNSKRSNGMSGQNKDIENQMLWLQHYLTRLGVIPEEVLNQRPENAYAHLVPGMGSRNSSTTSAAQTVIEMNHLAISKGSQFNESSAQTGSAEKVSRHGSASSDHGKSSHSGSTGSGHHSQHSSPASSGASQRKRSEYQKLPSDDQDDCGLRRQGGSTSVREHDLCVLKDDSDSASEKDSEASSGCGDSIDIPNPQIQAFNTLRSSDRDSAEYTWDDYGHISRFTSNGMKGDSPLHHPMGRGRLYGTSGARPSMNVVANPMNCGLQNSAMVESLNNQGDAYYQLNNLDISSSPAAV